MQWRLPRRKVSAVPENLLLSSYRSLSSFTHTVTVIVFRFFSLKVMKISSIIAIATGFVASVVAQTPPGYTWAQTNNTLYFKYPGFPVFKGGAILPYAGMSIVKAPTLRASCIDLQQQNPHTSHTYTRPRRSMAPI